MHATRFHQNIRSRMLLELFLMSAISSLLLVRLYLFLTGFPQIGGGGLHIAHVLWGGLLMLVALVLSFSFLGARMQRVVAVIGGIGFGVFIDELGKFITHNNDYFYQPTIALLYALFFILFYVIRFLARDRPLSSREYQLNALYQLEEAFMHDLDHEEKEEVNRLLSKADQNDPLTLALRTLLQGVSIAKKPQPSRIDRLASKIREHLSLTYRHIKLVRMAEIAFFIIGATVSLGWNIVAAIQAENKNAVASSLIISTLISGLFIAWGAYNLRTSRINAFRQFRRATLVQLLLPQFFYFGILEFAALPNFLFCLALLNFLERTLNKKAATLAPRPVS